MFAVVKISGKQYKVEEKQILEVDKIEGNEGDIVQIKEVLLLVNDKGDVKIGKPFVENSLVEAEILEQKRGPKIIVFKYRPKKGYHKKQGHRSWITKILIKKIK
jgi:large subunit ribosomal protein L21